MLASLVTKSLGIALASSRIATQIIEAINDATTRVGILEGQMANKVSSQTVELDNLHTKEVDDYINLFELPAGAKVLSIYLAPKPSWPDVGGFGANLDGILGNTEDDDAYANEFGDPYGILISGIPAPVKGVVNSSATTVRLKVTTAATNFLSTNVLYAAIQYEEAE